MSDVKWIKIVTDIFDDEKILLIETLPEADSIIVIWFKLLCLSGKQNNSGVFVMGNGLPYTDKMLATIFRRKEATVKLAIDTFHKFGMIEIIENIITIPNWEKHQRLNQLEMAREATRKRVEKHREKQKMLANGECNVTVTLPVTVCNGDRVDKNRLDKNRIDIDIAESEDSSPKNVKPVRHKYGEYKNVLLTDKQYEELKEAFPTDYKERIERLSEYMSSTGKVYKNHLTTIKAWARREKEQGKAQGKPKAAPNKRIFRNGQEDIYSDEVYEVF